MPLHAESKRGRAALERIAYQRLGYVGAGSSEQIAEIVDRALAEPPPFEHSHSWEECGMCTECDAAWVLARRAEETED